MHIEQHMPLAPLTSLRLGGPARYLARCTSVEDLRESLAWAAERGQPTHVLGGGSNTVFADAGFAGLVVHVQLRGVDITTEGDTALVTAAAGEDWDPLVARCVAADLTGVECLSGIPGLVGATPMQNVGAYGQEVAESIVEVRAIERDSLEEVEFDHVGVFEYSDEEGTTAYDYQDKVPADVAEERKSTLMEIQRRVSLRKNERRIGQTLPVLVEAFDEESMLLMGRAAFQAPEIDGQMIIEESDAQPGQILPLKIIRALEYDLIGRTLS